MALSPAGSSDQPPLQRAGETEPVVFLEGDSKRAFVGDRQEEFPRPATRLNRIVALAAAGLPQRRLTQADIRRWLNDSTQVFAQLVEDQRPLERLSRETAWVLSDTPPPDPDVWSGECKFADGGIPIVVCYKQTLASRLPGAAFEVAWQGAMDHFVGHLYPYFAGAAEADEYGEEVACRYQHLAAQFRARSDRRYRIIARLMPLTYRMHKHIPLSNYERLAAA